MGKTVGSQRDPRLRLLPTLRHLTAVCLIAAIAGFLASPASAEGPIEWIQDLFTWPPFGIGKKAEEGPRARYKPALELTGAEQLKSRIKKTATLFTKRSKPPATLVGVEYRAKEDVETIRKLLRSEGYFASRIDWRITENEGKKGDPATAVLVIDAGPRYSFGDVQVVRKPGSAGKATAIQKPATASPYSSDAILKTETAIFSSYKARGFPFVKIASRRIVVDHRTRRVAVTWNVDPNARVRFGEVRIKGARGVNHALVRRRIAWRRGQQWDSTLVDETVDRLRSLDVFGSIQIRPDKSAVGANGETPIDIILTERKRRTIGASIYYDTSIGPGAEVEWRHRNLFGGAESFQIKLIGSQQIFGAQTFFRKPDVFGGAQDLQIAGRYHEIRTDAYDGREGVIGVYLAQQFGKRLKVKAGPLFDWSEQEQFGVRRSYLLGGLDFEAEYDGADKALDPTRGFRLKLNVTPYMGENLSLEKNLSFARVFARGSVYVTPFRQKKVTFAAWSRIGAVIGEDLADLPPNKKIYAGGGGSIRGFGSQRVGPLDSANDPSGGRSLVEGGIEVRWRFGKSWGAVAFLEAGNVFQEIVPRFDNGVRIGAGIGIRYKSPVGLLRLDVATPVNPRRGDSRIQIYISIGQAF